MTTTTNTTIENWVETFATALSKAHFFYGDPPTSEDIEALTDAMRAVIEKHVGPMLREAYTYGGEITHEDMDELQKRAATYADRILSDLTAARPKPEEQK